MLAEVERLRDTETPLSLRNGFHGYNTERWFDLLNCGECASNNGVCSVRRPSSSRSQPLAALWGRVWQRVATHPALLGPARALLGRDCILNTFGTSIVGPGESAQAMHVDDAIFVGPHDYQKPMRNRERLPDGGRQSIVLGVMIALNQFTEEVGATRVLRDSNLMDYPAAGEPDPAWMEESVPALMGRGSVLFFEGQCYHAGGANTTQDRKRIGVTVHYCAGYLRAQENFILSIAEERAAAFSPELQGLIGYKLSASVSAPTPPPAPALRSCPCASRLVARR